MSKKHLILILSVEGDHSNTEINWLNGLVNCSDRSDKEFMVHAIGKLSRESKKSRIEEHRHKVRNIFQDIHSFDIYSEVDILYVGDLDHDMHVDSMIYSSEIATKEIVELFSNCKISFIKGIICDHGKKFEDMIFHKLSQEEINNIKWINKIKSNTFKKLFSEWLSTCKLSYNNWDDLVLKLQEYFKDTKYIEIFNIFVK